MHTRTCMHHGILGILDYHLARSFKTDSGVRASIFFLYFVIFPVFLPSLTSASMNFKMTNISYYYTVIYFANPFFYSVHFLT